MKLFTCIFTFIVVFVKESTEILKHENHNINYNPKLKNSPIFQQFQPQTCDLMCPGQPPLALPPNFLQNSQPVDPNTTLKPNNNNTSTTQKVTSTTQKPANGNGTATNNNGTTTENGEDNENNTETPDKRKATEQKKNKSEITKKHYLKSEKHNSKFHNYQLLRDNLKRRGFKSHKVILKMKNKMSLFGKRKHMKERYRLDGCYVVCPDNPGPAALGGESSGAPVSQEPIPSDNDSDNYVPGEDSPLEIIYVPPNIIQQPSPQIPHQETPINVPQSAPAVPQNAPQNIPQYMENVARPLIGQMSPFIPPAFDPFSQFPGIPWDFGPFFRAQKEGHVRKVTT